MYCTSKSRLDPIYSWNNLQGSLLRGLTVGPDQGPDHIKTTTRKTTRGNYTTKEYKEQSDKATPPRKSAMPAIYLRLSNGELLILEGPGAATNGQ